MSERLCRHCRTPLVRHANEGPAKFAIRVFCNRRCVVFGNSTAKLALHTITVRVCPCGTSYTRQASESYRDFVERKFCRNDCRVKRAELAGVWRERRSDKQVAASQAWGRNGPVQRATFVHQPPPKGTHFETSAEWLKRHEPTRVAPAYCAPVIGAGR